ncbi:hypothetical protein IMG5_170250, partial [Ichthyophthirius multifiliis]
NLKIKIIQKKKIKKKIIKKIQNVLYSFFNKKAQKNFNLLHLESNEYYILSLNVALIVDLHYEEIQGKLHLCSRSLIFEPQEIDLPLLKMKYSNNLFLKLVKGVNHLKLKALLLTSTEINNLNEAQLDKEIKQIQNKQKQPNTNKQNNTFELIERLYIPKQKNKNNTNVCNSNQLTTNYFKDVILNTIFIQNEKVFVIYRNPVTPYLTEKNYDNIVISLDKNNSKEQIIKFLKFFDGFMKTKDEQQYINFLIDNSVQQSIKEFVNQKKIQNKQVDFIFKCQKVVPEGNQHGFFTVVNEYNLIFCPLINSIDQKIIECKLSDVKCILKYRYLMKHIGIEIWLYNKKRSLLLIFDDNKIQQSVFDFLDKNCNKVQQYGMTKDQVQKLWINRSISNFEYIMYLNTIANRSFNDISAYPVFPWVVQDHKTNNLELDNPDFFRDLSKPIGAINKHRLQKLKDFYTNIYQEKHKNAEGYIYPTHYSSPGLIVYFLIRKIPEFVIKLQNGVFGPSDRIFRSVENTWQATLNLEADFKELIPEFYYSDGDFLVNNEKLELGITPEGESIDDVILPNWAHSIHDYIQKMKICLESDYVSENINNWIDLIFGYKQQGEAAKKANNLFYPLTYEQNVQWNQYNSPYEKAAMETQVTEFGQCPVQLFQKAHPQRKSKFISKNLSNCDEKTYVMMCQKFQEAQQQNIKMKEKINQLNEVIEVLAQNENLNQFIRGFQEKVDQESSINSNFLHTGEDQQPQPLNENDFDFLNDTGNSNN